VCMRPSKPRRGNRHGSPACRFPHDPIIVRALCFRKKPSRHVSESHRPNCEQFSAAMLFVVHRVALFRANENVPHRRNSAGY
jgi:hypothetical protein